uniref:Uncharacterized protein n=1 Tax=Lygus hesperus TaxID=30085 RepID=A0A0K8SLH4_LYGHE
MVLDCPSSPCRALGTPPTLRVSEPVFTIAPAGKDSDGSHRAKSLELAETGFENPGLSVVGRLPSVPISTRKCGSTHTVFAEHLADARLFPSDVEPDAKYSYLGCSGQCRFFPHFKRDECSPSSESIFPTLHMRFSPG